MELYNDLVKYSNSIYNLYGKLSKELNKDKCDFSMLKQLSEYLKMAREMEDKNISRISELEKKKILEYYSSSIFEKCYISSPTFNFNDQDIKNHHLTGRLESHYFYRDCGGYSDSNFVGGVYISPIGSGFNKHIDFLLDGFDKNMMLDFSILPSYISMVNINYARRLLNDDNLYLEEANEIILNFSYLDSMLENYLLCKNFNPDLDEMNLTVSSLCDYYKSDNSYKVLSYSYYKLPILEFLKNFFMYEFDDSLLFVYSDIFMAYYELLDDDVRKGYYDTYCRLNKNNGDLQTNYLFDEMKKFELLKK